ELRLVRHFHAARPGSDLGSEDPGGEDFEADSVFAAPAAVPGAHPDIPSIDPGRHPHIGAESSKTLFCESRESKPEVSSSALPRSRSESCAPGPDSRVPGAA